MSKKKSKEREERVPVQAYVPKSVYKHFKHRYPQRGAISKLIRQAFLAALEEDEETEKRARAAGSVLPVEEASDQGTEKDG